MTARDDLLACMHATASNDYDRMLLGRYYGLNGAPVCQAELAQSLGVTRQAISARMRRLMRRLPQDFAHTLSVAAAGQVSIRSPYATVSDDLLGGLPLESARRFYADLPGAPRLAENYPRLRPEEFLALKRAAFPVRNRRADEVARAVLVDGKDLKNACKQYGVSPYAVRETLESITNLHIHAALAYAT